jgi:hypothetical protein
MEAKQVERAGVEDDRHDSSSKKQWGILIAATVGALASLLLLLRSVQ